MNDNEGFGSKTGRLYFGYFHEIYEIAGILHLSVYTLKSGSLSLSRVNCFDPDSDPDPDPDPDLESVNHFPGFMKDATLLMKFFRVFRVFSGFIKMAEIRTRPGNAKPGYAV